MVKEHLTIVADIAGQYDAFLRLIKQVPKEDKIILVGDLVDRGPKSKEVIEWAMTTPNVVTLLGNHEHMMIDWYRSGGVYGGDIWFMNGGIKTLESYGYEKGKPLVKQRNIIPESHIEWLENLPLTYETEDFYISHAPKSRQIGDSEKDRKGSLNQIWREDANFVWNRRQPIDMNDRVQIFGHNSHWGLKTGDRDDGTASWICLDDSRKDILTALNTREFEVFQEPYEEEK